MNPNPHTAIQTTAARIIASNNGNQLLELWQASKCVYKSALQQLTFPQRVESFEILITMSQLNTTSWCKKWQLRCVLEQLVKVHRRRTYLQCVGVFEEPITRSYFDKMVLFLSLVSLIVTLSYSFPVVASRTDEQLAIYIPCNSTPIITPTWSKISSNVTSNSTSQTIEVQYKAIDSPTYKGALTALLVAAISTLFFAASYGKALKQQICQESWAIQDLQSTLQVLIPKYPMLGIGRNPVPPPNLQQQEIIENPRIDLQQDNPVFRQNREGQASMTQEYISEDQP